MIYSNLKKKNKVAPVALVYLVSLLKMGLSALQREEKPLISMSTAGIRYGQKWMVESMDGWMDKCMYVCMCLCLYVSMYPCHGIVNAGFC